MKSRASFFNGTVLKKDFTRFSPVWVLYSLWLVITVMRCSSSTSYAHALEGTLREFGIIVCGYALLNAQLLFGDLYSVKMSNALHALPLRRETWFGSHVTAGLLFCLVPNALMMFASALLMTSLRDVAVYWFLSVTLQYLFYFGLAVFCAMIVGNRIGMAAFYILVNAGAWLVYWLVDTLYIPLIPDISITFLFFSPLCPLVYLFMHQPVAVELKYSGYYPVTVVSESLTVDAGAWIYLTVLAVIGMALLVPALFTYRKRHLESAGSLVTVRWLRPVFLVALTLTLGVLFRYLLGGVMLLDGASVNIQSWIYLVIGLLVGYFTGQMLLMRTVRVLNWKNLAGFASIVVLLLGSMGVTMLDPMDLKHWVPDASLVESMYFSAPGYWAHQPSEELPHLEEVLELNRVILAEGDVELTGTVTEHEYTWPDSDGTVYSETYSHTEYNGFTVCIHYTLRNGVTISREYPVLYDGSVEQEIAKFLSQPEIALGDLYENQQLLLSTIYLKPSAHQYVYFTEEEGRVLLDALIADCEAGTMAQHDNYHDGAGYELPLRWKPDWKYVSVSLVIYPEAENTMAWLEQQEFYQEYLKSLITDEITGE